MQIQNELSLAIIQAGWLQIKDGCKSLAFVPVHLFLWRNTFSRNCFSLVLLANTQIPNLRWPNDLKFSFFSSASTSFINNIVFLIFKRRLTQFLLLSHKIGIIL